MEPADRPPSASQRRVARLVLAILTDVVVLNLFVEHVEAIAIDSFTISLGAAVLIRVLIEVTLNAEHRVAAWFEERAGARARVGRVFGAWLVLFGSKFVILESIYLVFGDRVDLGGLGWVIALSLAMVVAERLLLAGYRRL